MKQTPTKKIKKRKVRFFLIGILFLIIEWISFLLMIIKESLYFGILIIPAAIIGIIFINKYLGNMSND